SAWSLFWAPAHSSAFVSPMTRPVSRSTSSFKQFRKRVHAGIQRLAKGQRAVLRLPPDQPGHLILWSRSRSAVRSTSPSGPATRPCRSGPHKWARPPTTLAQIGWRGAKAARTDFHRGLEGSQLSWLYGENSIGPRTPRYRTHPTLHSSSLTCPHL